MITFYEEGHKYLRDSDGKQLLSVSGLASLYEEKKDWDKICKRTAKKRGIDPKELRAKWDNKNKIATQAGTKLHEIKEMELLNAPYIFDGIELSKPNYKFGKSEKKLPSQKLENNHVYPEHMVYNEYYAITGQSDKVVISNNTIYILDYKTDQQLSWKAFASEWVEAEKFLDPISHLEKCNGNEYALKMSLYMYLVWLENREYKMGDIIIEHVSIERDEDGVPVLHDGIPNIIEEKEYRPKLLLREAKLILEHYRENHGN